jgi:hypothetical protein
MVSDGSRSVRRRCAKSQAPVITVSADSQPGATIASPPPLGEDTGERSAVVAVTRRARLRRRGDAQGAAREPCVSRADDSAMKIGLNPPRDETVTVWSEGRQASEGSFVGRRLPLYIITLIKWRFRKVLFAVCLAHVATKLRRRLRALRSLLHDSLHLPFPQLLLNLCVMMFSMPSPRRR